MAETSQHTTAAGSATQPGMTRREFLVRSTATGAGVMLGIALGPGRLGTVAPAGAAEGMDAFTPATWFTITPAGKTTLHIVTAAMGQHVGTSLAQVIAEELEVTSDHVRLHVPLERAENFA